MATRYSKENGSDGEARTSLSINEGVAYLTLTRSDKYNALDPAMLSELLEALTILKQNEEIRVLVLGGQGPSFSAGVDLRTPFFMEHVLSDSVFEGMRLLDWQHELITGLYDLPFLTIASVHGNVVGGGGFGTAMACDLRFAARDTRFWMVPGVLDVVQDFGLTWLLQRVIGLSRTMEFAFSGTPIDSSQGERMGLVNRVYDSREELDEGVSEFAASVGRRGVDAARLLKFIIRHGAENGLSNQVRLEAITNGLCFQSSEFRARKMDYMKRLGMAEE